MPLRTSPRPFSLNVEFARLAIDRRRNRPDDVSRENGLAGRPARRLVDQVFPVKTGYRARD